MTSFTNTFSEEIWASTHRASTDATIDDTLRRVCKAVASVEKDSDYWEEEFYRLLSDFHLIPGGRILANAGTDWEGTTLLNCFVGGLPENPDSISGIMQVLTEQTLTLKSEGGHGLNYSFIRPRGSLIRGIGGETPGAVKFLELFDKSSEIITSGAGIDTKNTKKKAKIRKGACMGIMDVWHPDIMEFISAKTQPGVLQKFNLSVNCSDEFMAIIDRLDAMRASGCSEEEIAAVDRWQLVFPDTSSPHYHKWNGDLAAWRAAGHPIIVHREIPASMLWDAIMKSTYERNDPGVIFLDRANSLYALNYAERLVASNPCGEQILPENGACLLGTLNITQFITDGNIDHDKLARYTKIAVRFLDNVNDLTTTPLPAYRNFLVSHRRIGLGIMGWASSLYMMKVRFAGDRDLDLIDQVMRTIVFSAVEASIDLAEEKGAFPLCQPEKHAMGRFWDIIGLPDHMRERMSRVGIRNSSLFSIQPNGNTSILANLTSGGLEPVFTPQYIRTVIVPTCPPDMMPFTPRYWEGEMVETEIFRWDTEGTDRVLVGEWQNVRYKIDAARGLTKEVPCRDYGMQYCLDSHTWDANAEWAVDTAKLTAEDHIRSLTAFSRWIDSSMSKTINLPHDYPYEQFKRIYLDCYRAGTIKGVTTYRAGTMMSVLSQASDSTIRKQTDIIVDDIRIPDTCPAVMKVLRADGAKWYTTVILMENRPMAVFAQTNHHPTVDNVQGTITAMLDLAVARGIPLNHITTLISKMTEDDNVSKICRVISLNLRHGVPIRDIVQMLADTGRLGSFVHQVSKMLATYIDGEETGERCHCGGTVVYSEGCHKCLACGDGACS